MVMLKVVLMTLARSLFSLPTQTLLIIEVYMLKWYLMETVRWFGEEFGVHTEESRLAGEVVSTQHYTASTSP